MLSVVLQVHGKIGLNTSTRGGASGFGEQDFCIEMKLRSGSDAEGPNHGYIMAFKDGAHDGQFLSIHINPFRFLVGDGGKF